MFEYIFSDANKISAGIHEVKGNLGPTTVIIASHLIYEAATIIGGLNYTKPNKILNLNLDEYNREHTKFIVNQIKVSTVFMHIAVHCSSVGVLNIVEPIFKTLTQGFPREVRFLLKGIVVNPGKHIYNYVIFNHVPKQKFVTTPYNSSQCSSSDSENGKHNSIDQIMMVINPQLPETKMPLFETLYTEFTFFPKFEEFSQPTNQCELSPHI